MEPSYIAAGMLTGFVVGVTGVGGGALMTPILLLVFGISPAIAIGTDLWFAALTKIAITGVHAGRGIVDWQVARRLWCGSLAATVATLSWIYFQPASSRTSSLLVAAVAIAVGITAIAMLAQPALQRFAQQRLSSRASAFIAFQGPATVAAGAVLGALVTLTSVGSGALGVVMLLYLYPTRLTPRRLIATDIVHAIPLTMIAGLGHLIAGRVDAVVLGNLLLGSVPAGLIGAAVSSRLSHTKLRLALAAVLLGVSAKMIAGAVMAK